MRYTYEKETRLDNRYQEGEVYESNNDELFLRWKYSRKLGIEFFLKDYSEIDSRYQTSSNNQEASIEFKYTHDNALNYLCKLSGGTQENSDEDGMIEYELLQYEISPALNWYPGKGKRLYAKMKYRKNSSQKGSYSTWQEENREGDVFTGNISYVYQFSRYMTFSVNYKFEKYPLEKLHNEVEMQVSAEF